MSLSVLLATHNGADTIERTLEAFSQLDAPVGGWELIVVNNASTDDTEARVLKWRDRLPVQYCVEPRLGKSFAMNTALERASGDLIVMTDDDVLPVRGWLTEWLRVAGSYPQCAAFGGAITPHFDKTPPAWRAVRSDFSVLYGQTVDCPEGRMAMTESGCLNVFGGNMAIRASVRDDGWRFGESFLVGQEGLMGEDSDFVRRLYHAGMDVGFAPGAIVGHIIQNDQLSLGWMMKRFFRHGRSMFLLDEAKSQDGGGFKFPRWRLIRASRRALELSLALLLVRRNRAFALARALAYDLGALTQARLLSRQDKLIPRLIPSNDQIAMRA